MGDKPTFDFEPRDHLELGETLEAIDIARGVKVSGSRFYFLKGVGARLELALMNYGARYGARRRASPLLLRPTLVKPEIMSGTGFLGAHADEVYHLPDDDLYLTGTSEVALAGYHADEIVDVSGGPLRYAGWSTCYRREAGSYGKDTRGIIRVHQFQKLEMFSYIDPAQAEAEHERLLALQEGMLQALGLAYRVIDTAAGDLGTSAARKFDVEAWVPTQGAYRELTSTSNCTTFQARRLDTRFRGEDGEDEPRRDAQRHARDDALDRRHPRDPPARRRLGRRARGAAPSSRPARTRPRWSPTTTRCASIPAGDRWLVALDIDGTVLHEDGTLSDAVLREVHRVRDAGHEVMLATGRSVAMTLPVLDRLDIAPHYVVCSNGAITLGATRTRRRATGATMSRRSMRRMSSRASARI